MHPLQGSNCGVLPAIRDHSGHLRLLIEAVLRVDMFFPNLAESTMHCRRIGSRPFGSLSTITNLCVPKRAVVRVAPTIIWRFRSRISPAATCGSGIFELVRLLSWRSISYRTSKVPARRVAMFSTLERAMDGCLIGWHNVVTVRWPSICWSMTATGLVRPGITSNLYLHFCASGLKWIAFHLCRHSSM